MTNIEKYVQENLFALADKEYKNFHSMCFWMSEQFFIDVIVDYQY